MEGTPHSALEDVLERLTSLRQYQHKGKRVPHKPLLVLLALGQLETTGSSAVSWDLARDRLADLIASFGPQTRTSRSQSAAYPFTRLRRDGIWTLDVDVPDDSVRELTAVRPTGRLAPDLERRLRSSTVRYAAAHAIVEAHFPDTIAQDVLLASGLDPDFLHHFSATAPGLSARRQRSRRWVAQILKAWDECCAFCAYDGRLGSTPVGIEAAHVRWFNFDGPDDLDNGFALCSLHHKLFDRGALGLSPDMTVLVSPTFTARTDASKQLYELQGRELRPRPGTELPAERHRAWHEEQVFKSAA